jgi:RNA polymerase sigma-70 factor (ECF subfamily)
LQSEVENVGEPQRIGAATDTPLSMSSVGARPLPAPETAEREDTSFVGLYRTHFAFVWRCLRGLGVPPASLDDAAQDVFVVVHRRLPEFRGDSSVRTWLYAVLRNVAANQRRGDRRVQAQVELDEQLPSAAPDALQRVQEREAGEFVRAFREGLDDKRRDVFVLCMIERLPIPEAAATLGIPLNTAYTRLRAVRIDFRTALAKRQETA